MSAYEDVLRPLDAAGDLEKPRGAERLNRSEQSHQEDVERLHIDDGDRVVAELECLIVEIGGDTPWVELESMIRSTFVDELGRELRSDEEQRLLEAWVTLAPAVAA